MRYLIRAGPLVLLALLLIGCATQQEIDDMGTQMASTGTAWQSTSVANAAATLIAAGTQLPTWTPTDIPTPTPTMTPTPTITPSPTPTPFTGWMKYDENGGSTMMPSGFQPNCGGVVGCPGTSYTWFQDGVPQNGIPGKTTGTQSTWPWVLGGIVALCIVVPLMYFTAWQNAAPFRAAEKAMLEIPRMFGQPEPTTQLALGDPDHILAEDLGRLLTQFMSRYPVPVRKQLEPYMGKYLSPYHVGDLIPLTVIVKMLTAHDREHKPKLARQFGEHLDRLTDGRS